MAVRRSLWLLVVALFCLRSASAQVASKQPILFADGITRRDELPQYVKTGLNTVVVRVPWRQTEDGALTFDDLAPVRAFADDAASRGLNIIYALPATPQGLESQLRVSADGQAYFALWEAWVASVVRATKDTPRLLGWMLPDDPRALNFADDLAFSRWIQRNYASAQVLNAQWDADFKTLNIGLRDAQGVARRWKSGNRLPNEFSGAQLEAAQEYAKRTPSPQTRNWAFHPASLAVAQFKLDAWRALVSGWAERLRASDPDTSRPIFSGRLPDYAQTLALPANVDVCWADARPTFAERDFAAGNPNAISVARRGGTVRAIATLQSAPADGLDSAQLLRALPAWMNANLARGAGGFAFSDWNAIARDEKLQTAIATHLAKLNAPGTRELWNQAPVSTFAVVASPLSDAYQLPIEGVTRGLYGFGDDLVPSEPADLLYALRHGTAFGSVDVLSIDDLTRPQTPLSRYNTLLLPQALSLPDEAAQSLQRYVYNGGVVVADLGAGALQSGGAVANLPPSLSALFGVVPSGVGVGAFNDNLRRISSHPLLPSFAGRSVRNDGTILTGGANANAPAFSGPVAYFEPQGSATPIALAARLDTVNGSARAMLTIHPIGNGFALYAPWRLWSGWSSGQGGFDAFHGDLFGRGATIVVADVTTLVPQPPRENAMLYPEVVNFAGAIGALNHDAKPQASAIFTSGVGQFLWSDGLALFGPSDAVVAEGRPAPIPDADEYQRAPHPVTLHLRPNAREMRLSRLRPVRAQNFSGGALCAQINAETPSSLQLTLWPNTTQIKPLNDDWGVQLGETGTVRVQVFDAPDAYRVTPNSRHRVSITDAGAKPDKSGARPTQTFDVVADGKGVVSFEARGKAMVIKVSPLR